MTVLLGCFLTAYLRLGEFYDEFSSFLKLKEPGSPQNIKLSQYALEEPPNAKNTYIKKVTERT